MKAPIKWHMLEGDYTLKRFSCVKNAAYCSVMACIPQGDGPIRDDVMSCVDVF